MTPDDRAHDTGPHAADPLHTAPRFIDSPAAWPMSTSRELHHEAIADRIMGIMIGDATSSAELNAATSAYHAARTALAELDTEVADRPLPWVSRIAIFVVFTVVGLFLLVGLGYLAQLFIWLIPAAFSWVA